MAIKHTIKGPGGLVTYELTPRTAIKCFCYECMGFQRPEIERCTATTCPLFPFRMGNAHSMSETQRRKQSELAKKRSAA